MAAFTCTLRCGIDEALRALEDAVLGGNRVSLSLTLLGGGPCTELCAVASGGSQALFFKINTFGEEAFLDCVRAAAERLC